LLLRRPLSHFICNVSNRSGGGALTTRQSHRALIVADSGLGAADAGG
jgi:hypothetical protein